MEAVENNNNGVPVYIISPKNSKGDPIDLHFAVTEGGLVLHVQKMDETIPDETVSDELGKLLFGLEHSSGRYNEFVKDRSKYKIHMKVVTDMSLDDARQINNLYYMSTEKRRQKLRKDMSWAEK